ncbi:hypothetical protein C8R46DRAFT_1027846 [Mycena filopes]|nr:hypothetical protein C8R46DRAFT_1027846 [Mycena filopes]
MAGYQKPRLRLSSNIRTATWVLLGSDTHHGSDSAFRHTAFNRAGVRNLCAAEAAEVGVSFDELNRPVVLTAEGDLQSKSLIAVDQRALSVAYPRTHAADLYEHLARTGNQTDHDDEGISRESSLTPSDEKHIPNSQVDWENPGDGFIVPRNTVKNNYKWLVSGKLDTRFKFFPTWFDLSEDDDQLGPVPEKWLKKEDIDLQKAVYASIDIGAGERSTGFAEYLEKMQAEPSQPKKSKGKRAAHDESKKAKKGKTNFTRADSQHVDGLEGTTQPQ